MISGENSTDNIMLDALKASKYPSQRTFNILKEIVNGILREGKVTFEDVYHQLHSLDSSYQEDEVRNAFDILSQPLFVIKQEKKGSYVLALGKHELNERLWLLNKIFLQSSTERTFPSE